MKKLTPAEEVEFLKEIHGGDYAKLFAVMREAFAILQTRSQMLLGLATICLAITGFSGPRMAASNQLCRRALAVIGCRILNNEKTAAERIAESAVVQVRMMLPCVSPSGV